MLNQKFRFLFFVLVSTTVYVACRKTDSVRAINEPVNTELTTKFFSTPSTLNPIVQLVANEVQRRNNLKEFINNFLKTKGYAIWDKAIVSLPEGRPGNNFGNSGSPNDSLVYIPLVIQNTGTTNGFLRAVINDSISLSYCMAKDYKNYPLVSANQTTADEFASLFMLMDKEIFGHEEFQITDNRLLEGNNDTTSPVNRKARIINVISGTANNLCEETITTIEYLVEDPANCTCIPKNVHCDWRTGCTSCSNTVTLTIVTGNTSGCGGEGPIGGGIPTTGGPSGGGTGGGGAPPPYYPCTNTPTALNLLPEPLPPCPPPNGGGGWTPVEATDATFNFESSAGIDLQKYFNCFDNIPDAGATYSVKLCADLPRNQYPYQAMNGMTPGHVFITLTKTNGSQSITQSFGFYPSNGILSTSMLPVSSKIVDDGHNNHEYNASILMNVSQIDFNAVKNLALAHANAMQYDLSDFNCTDFGLQCFNIARAVPISIDPLPGWGIINNTPNMLYIKLDYMKYTNAPEAANIQIGVFNAPTSYGACN